MSLPIETPINPNEVIEAYCELKLKPLKGAYFMLNNNRCHKVCPITVLYLKHLKDVFGVGKTKDVLMGIQRTVEGDGDEYICGFIIGFDENIQDNRWGKKYKKGYRDGKETLKKLKEHFSL